MAVEKENSPVVLVVEDEKPLLGAIDKKLKLNNFSVVTARSVKQALDYIDNLERIDIIWLDHYLLGKENGLGFVVKLKENKKTKKIPVFVISNTATPEKVNSYIKLGVSKYYTKSNYRLDEIIEEMKLFLQDNK